MSLPSYTFVIPTYKRPDVLEECLRHIAELDNSQGRVDVIVIDNGEQEHCRDVGMKFSGRLQLDYQVNERNLGPGGSLNKGLALAQGDRIIVSNDDAMVPSGFLNRCDEIFASDSRIGCIGFRAIEDGYHDDGKEIGSIDPAGRVLGNFSRPTETLLDVDHVYGFCYGLTRQALEQAGPFDRILLAQPYASGNRIETDHCLEIRRAGFRIVYDGQTGVRHMAKPRLDINERSLKWRLNEIRNTLYLFLKHFGWSGKRAMALRYALLHDLGIRSALLNPNRDNWAYFFTGLRGRSSAVWHWLKWKTGAHRWGASG